MKKTGSMVPVVVLALLGGALVYWMTSVNGPAVDRDSVGYLQAARAIATGQGPMVYNNAGVPVPMPFPQAFYAFLLAGGWLVGIGFQEWGRWLGVLFFCSEHFSGRSVCFSRLPQDGPGFDRSCDRALFSIERRDPRLGPSGAAGAYAGPGDPLVHGALRRG